MPLTRKSDEHSLEFGEFEPLTEDVEQVVAGLRLTPDSHDRIVRLGSRLERGVSAHDDSIERCRCLVEEAPPVSTENRAFGRRWTLLVEAEPRPLSDCLAPALQRRARKRLRQQSLAGLSPALVRLGDRRQRDQLPAVGCVLAKEPAQQVVLMPSPL